jgi:hypothetical protein
MSISPDRQTHGADVIHSNADDRLPSCRYPTNLSTCYQTDDAGPAFDQLSSCGKKSAHPWTIISGGVPRG